MVILHWKFSESKRATNDAQLQLHLNHTCFFLSIGFPFQHFVKVQCLTMWLFLCIPVLVANTKVSLVDLDDNHKILTKLYWNQIALSCYRTKHTLMIKNCHSRLLSKCDFCPGEATWGGEKTKQEDDYEDASFEVTFWLNDEETALIWSFDMMMK